MEYVYVTKIFSDAMQSDEMEFDLQAVRVHKTAMGAFKFIVNDAKAALTMLLQGRPEQDGQDMVCIDTNSHGHNAKVYLDGRIVVSYICERLPIEE